MKVRPVDQRISFPFNAVYRFSATHPLAWLSGKRHTGVDFASPIGTPVRAPVAMTQTQILHHRTGYGNHIIAKTLDGKYTLLFAHLSTVGIPRIGKVWKKGEVFAWTGSSGASSGPHLHFEVRNAVGAVIDPIEWLRDPESLLTRVNEALRAAGSEVNAKTSQYYQQRVVDDPQKFTNDEQGFTHLVNAIKWHLSRNKHPHI
jgi:murein DD-endopeptidase MepM/ murein hydrolase activator NlpD